MIADKYDLISNKMGIFCFVQYIYFSQNFLITKVKTTGITSGSILLIKYKDSCMGSFLGTEF